MIEEELIKIWQSSPNQERAKFEKSRLMIDVQSSLDKLHRSIKYRDLREQIAAAIVIPAFAFTAYAIPPVLSKIVSVVIVFWAIYIIIKLRNAKAHKPSQFTESYIQYLYNTRAYILIQKQMLDNVLYWYILPGMTLTTLFVAGFGVPIKTIKMGIGNILLGIASYFMNKRAVEKDLMPRLAKIDELIRVLEL